MPYESLKKFAVILAIVVLAVVILFYGKPFLMPLAFAIFLSTLLLPVCNWLEKKGVNRVISILLSILLILLFVSALIFLLGWQVSDLTQDAGEIKKQFTEKYQEVVQYISDKTGVSQAQQKKMVQNQNSSSQKGTSFIATFVAGLGTMMTNFLLIIVYIFLFLYFRGHLKRSLVRFVPHEDETQALQIVNRAQKVSQKYLMGMAMMIAALWVMYGIGFSIAGVKHAIFFAILCGVLEVVPFVGNLLGTSLTMLMSFAQGADTNVIIGILITYAVVQFLQTYILEPLVVGSEVNINPLFTILGLVASEMIWGISGMILAIPVMGVSKIIFDHVESLQPLGKLMGEEKKKNKKGFKEKMTSLVKKVAGRKT